MLWHKLKLSNLAEFQKFCNKEWAKIPPQQSERLISLIAGVAGEDVIRFRGQLLFHVRLVGLDSFFFSLINITLFTLVAFV